MNNRPTPRINSKLREKYVGTTVRIAGKVISFAGDTAVIEATDHGQVLVKLNGESQWGADYVEVIGKIERDFSLVEFATTSLGSNFDLDLANKVVEYGQKYSQLFE